ncbi:MAG: PAS domain S-box protein [Gemmatimonadaceae bacterium]|nr:PAS domain S-box protein [Gemmatimonadaceae bacterium]
MRPTLTTKIGLLLLLPFLGSLAGTLVFASYLQRARTTDHVVNVAGRQRLLAAELRDWAHIVALGQEEDRAGLRSRVAEFEHSLVALQRGGQVLDGVVDAAPPDLTPELAAVASLWHQLRPDLLTIAEASRQEARFVAAYQRVENRLPQLRDLAHRYLTAFVARHQRERREMLWTLGFIAVGNLAVLLAGLFITRRYIVRPIIGLETAARRMQAGDFAHRLDASARDELGTLARTFNAMVEQVEQLLAALDLRRKHAETIVASVSSWLLVLRQDLTVLQVNRSFREAFGPDEGAVGQPVTALLPAPGLLEAALEVLASGKPQRGLQLEMPWQGGTRSLRVTITGTRLEEEEEEAEAEVLLVAVEDLTTEERLTARARLLAAALESVGDPVTITNPAGAIQFVNAAFSRQNGYDVAEVLGKNPRILKSGQTDAAVYPALWQALTAGRTFSDTVVNRRKDGSTYEAVLTITPVCDASGTVTQYVSTHHDITERKRAERQSEGERSVLELLAKGEALPVLLTRLALSYEAMYPGILCSVLLLDAEGRHLTHSAAPSLPAAYCQAIDGMEIGPLVGSCGTAAYTGQTTMVADIASDPLWRDYKALALAHGLLACWSVPILSTKGRVLGTFALYHRTPRAAQPEELAAVERGARLASLAIERQQTEEQLARNAELLRCTGELAMVGGWELDLLTMKLTWSEEVYRIHEVDPAIAPVVEQVIEFYAPEARPVIQAAVQAGIASGTPWDLELPLITAKGRHIWVHAQGRAVMRDSKVVRLTGAFQNITGRKQAEEALRFSEAELRGLIERAVFGIYRSTPDGCLLMVNQALVEMLGYDSAEEVLAVSTVATLYQHPEERSRLLERYAAHDAFTGVEAGWKRKDDTPITVRLSGKPVRGPGGEPVTFEVFVEDVTERVVLENRLRQSQKMQAVGDLAGGLAHDFNNLLTAILGSSELMASELPAGSPVGENLDTIRRAALRAAELTRKLLGFSRRQHLELQPVDLGAVVTDFGRMMRRVIREDIHVRVIVDEARLGALADSGAVEQILMNLMTNARDATPPGGALLVKARRAVLDEAYCEGRGWGRAGAYIAIEVSDTGAGMDEETRHRIFEPFFTTKPMGKGTGLGMAMVYGLVKQHGGFVDVSSALGRGTTVCVFLPAVAEEGSERPAVAAPPLGRGGRNDSPRRRRGGGATPGAARARGMGVHGAGGGERCGGARDVRGASGSHCVGDFRCRDAGHGRARAVSDLAAGGAPGPIPVHQRVHERVHGARGRRDRDDPTRRPLPLEAVARGGFPWESADGAGRVGMTRAARCPPNGNHGGRCLPPALFCGRGRVG